MFIFLQIDDTKNQTKEIVECIKELTFWWKCYIGIQKFICQTWCSFKIKWFICFSFKSKHSEAKLLILTSENYRKLFFNFYISNSLKMCEFNKNISAWKFVWIIFLFIDFKKCILYFFILNLLLILIRVSRGSFSLLTPLL